MPRYAPRLRHVRDVSLALQGDEILTIAAGDDAGL
jgi:hypothetical protein